MRYYILVSFFALNFALNHTAEAAILIENGQRVETERVQSKSRTRIKNTYSTDSGISLREKKRVGIGTSVAGPLGVLGVMLDVNLTARDSFLAGYGTGFSYQAYTFQYKRMLAGEWLLPYMALGLSRWYTTGENKPVGETQPSFLAGQFLSESEKESGEFSEFILYPAFGLQYMQLNGDWVGLSFYAEVDWLVDIDDFEAAPSIGVGALYYF